jgi:hypothetical protein
LNFLPSSIGCTARIGTIYTSFELIVILRHIGRDRKRSLNFLLSVEATEVVEVRSGGTVCGNVKGPRVILHDGAIVVGGLDMSAALSAVPKQADPKSAGQAPATAGDGKP